MAGGDSSGETSTTPEITLEYTPTWIVAAVCSGIVIISLIFERLLHYGGKALKKRNKKPLFDALQKIKEELMLLGFISLLMTVFQGEFQRICVNEKFMHHWEPCKHTSSSSTKHLTDDFFTGSFRGARQLLASGGSSHNCKPGYVPLLSPAAVHELHIFIFVLVVTHVTLSAITVALGLSHMNVWGRWERKIQQELMMAAGDADAHQMVRHVEQFKFIQDRFKGFGKAGGLYGWLFSFFKQFYASITIEDYSTMRLGFIKTHCPTNPKFNFYKYMLRALEADFKRVVGTSWYLWASVMLFLLLNISGWHVYFWMSYVPLVILLVIGTKLEHIITQLAHEVAEKHTAMEGNHLYVTPSDKLFWFHRPKIILVLIHFILFQNAFEIAYFFWILTTFNIHSCMMGKMKFLIPRLVISVVTQLLCSYSTLPIYAIVSHMGSSFKRAIFEEHVQAGLLGWAANAKRRKGKGAVTTEAGSSDNGGIEMSNVSSASSPPPQ